MPEIGEKRTWRGIIIDFVKRSIPGRTPALDADCQVLDADLLLELRR